MPRPKKDGAAEPKKRSRNGCWPCKTRKVKCDEGRPICVNCQRQGETCDYSIRLNWEGRGKKKLDENSAEGQVNFSSGMITFEPTKPKARTKTPTPVKGEFQNSQLSVKAEANSTTQLCSTPNLSPPGAPQSPASDVSMIDPALMDTESSTSAYPESLYSGPQYTQSYERYRSVTPGTPLSAQPPGVSRLRQSHSVEGYSPDSDMRSPSVSTFSNRSMAFSGVDSPTSTPSFYGNIKDDEGTEASIDRPSKRIRREQSSHDLSNETAMPPPNSTFSSTLNPDAPSSNPLLPAESSTLPSLHSNDAFKYPSKLHTTDSPDLRRLSVSSLLSGPPEASFQHDHVYRSNNHDPQNWPVQYQADGTTTWGIDRGFKDLDIGKNDDMNAISGSSPVVMRDHLELALNNDGEVIPVEFGFGMQTNETTSENGGYYDKPVPISIPRALEPLPGKLLENPMNLLYFHHFLNHTAGCLIPHNCSSNPFKSILPQMAVQDENLLNLLLAYSASHRARVLRQLEPATRIALWVQDIFPNLRYALDDPAKIISNANLATAIMLASLEIISPTAFGVAVPWQNHLATARQMIVARGGPQTMQTASRSDKVSSFLWSWFAYLDVLGSLSGVKTNSSSSWILDYEVDDGNDYQIDCILGFTSRCICVLAKIAELARICDSERIGPDHTIQSAWKPAEDIVSLARKLEADLAASRLHPVRPCTHMQSTGEAEYHWDSLEMTATNEAFHWAGLVHLHRRILGKPSTHEDVQSAVREIVGSLYKVRKRSSAEACLLFPMFTAGCDAQDERQRSDILERLKGVEMFGMTQVHKARTLMERVWETGKPWETLVAGEFFG
ncbi:hypothetical protein B7494_g4380 [Chlorociboria aeruginascens]|nr:hypothetical protein B7494_g4380 [Chlorociboria aeruginascens]